MEFSKCSEMIINPFSVDFKCKKIISKLAEELTESAAEYPDYFNDLMFKLNHLGGLLSTQTDFDISFAEVNDISRIIKFLDFNFDVDGKDTLEKLLDYMRICSRYLGKKLFIFVNLKSYFNKEELESLYKNIFYEKMNILLIERIDYYEKTEFEKVKIIDSDLCEIS